MTVTKIGVAKIGVAKIAWVGIALAASCVQATANPAHDYMSSMNERDRNSWLTKLLVQMPGPCVVQRNFFRGFDAKGSALWSAGCANKTAYAIMVLDDAKGSTRIMDCKVLMARGNQDCFAKL